MTHRILGALKENTGSYVSGEVIAVMCGISRAAVKKHIDKLISHGYQITAVKKSGYMLKDLGDIFDLYSIKLFLGDYAEKLDIEFYDSIKSTNDTAKQHYISGGSGAVVAAYQTGGKGRLGRSFSSEEGGVYVSYYTKLLTDIDPMSVGKLTTVAAVAANRTCRSFGVDSGIKWPNDIFCGTKKLGGILGETVGTTDKLDFIVMGVGINVNNTHFNDDISHIAASIRQLTGKPALRAEVAARLIINIAQVLEELYSGGFDEVLGDYRKQCITIGKRISKSSDGKYNYTATGTDHNGNLIIKDDNGATETVYFGDVSVKH